MKVDLTRLWHDYAARFGRWFRTAFTANLGLKSLSLVFAIGVVAYQRAQQDEQQRTVPVAVVLRLPGEEAKRELMTQMPASVHATVRGGSRAIDSMIQAGIPPVELDLRDGRTARVVFEPNMFSLPAGVELKIIDPAAIDLEWENIITREIPVQSSITGNVAEGYEKGEVVVEPKTVAVRGPSSQVEVMQFARLAAFDVSGKTDGLYRHQIALDPPPPRVRYVGASSATVTVQIRRRMIRQQFQNLAIEVVGNPRISTKPRSVDVTVIGPPEVVAGLRKSLIVPQVKVHELGQEKGHGSAVVPVVVPLAKAEVEVQPPEVLVSW